MEPVKASSLKLPNGEVVETVIVRLPSGALVPRRPDEIFRRPTPPAPSLTTPAK